MKKDLYILDVSGYIFRAYYALPPMTNQKGETTHALFGFIRSLMKLIKEREVAHLIAVFDGPDNKQSRTELYEKYKAHRTEKLPDLPEQLLRAKEFCTLAGIPQIEVAGVEADDTMGSIATWAVKEGGFDNVYLCTSDKDLAQLVNDHIYLLNTWKNNLVIDADKVVEIYGVPPTKIIDLLAMMGDSSDNIPGLPGIGPKTAVKLLEEFGSLDALLAHPERIKGSKQQLFIEMKEEVLLSRRLATIHLDVPFPKDASHFVKQPLDQQMMGQFYSSMGFHSLLKELEKEKETVSVPVHYECITEAKRLDELLSFLMTQPEICFNVEGDQLDPTKANLVGIAFCCKIAQAYYIPCDNPATVAKLKSLFAHPTCSFYGHNIKHDCHLLEKAEMTLPRLIFDTKLASYLLTSDSRSHSLENIMLAYFNKVKLPLKELVGSGKKQKLLHEAPLEKVTEYACEEVDYTFRSRELFEKKLEEEKLTELFHNIEMLLVPILLKMEQRGVAIDTMYLEKMSSEIAKELQSLAKNIYQLAGEEFNISSPKQLSSILFEKLQYKPTKKGTSHFSTSAEVLEQLAITYPIAQEILIYRQLDKLKSTYLDALPKTVHPQTGRIHPNFIQFGTSTGRLACQEPNLQNIPIRTPLGKKIRTAFRPSDPSWRYLSADYSQIELRLLAHLSEDPTLIKAFQAGEDIHKYTASLMFACPLSEVTPIMRHQAKAVNFGIIYGQGPFGLSQELQIEVSQAKEFIEAYFARYPIIHQYIENQIALAHKNGYAVTMFQRKRPLVDIHSKNPHLQKASERLAVNMPLQGSAADLIKLAMIEIDRILSQKKWQSALLLQIHDELIFETPLEEAEELQKVVKEAMEGVMTLKVPLVVDLSIGKNWGEC